jgi:uncharacterized Zn finger protein (UPF0148 family)
MPVLQNQAMNSAKQAKQDNHIRAELKLVPDQGADMIADHGQSWTKGTCPNCGYPKADVDTEGVLWCPACGYSEKSCYT